MSKQGEEIRLENDAVVICSKCYGEFSYREVKENKFKCLDCAAAFWSGKLG